jgi:hypothetical protein
MPVHHIAAGVVMGSIRSCGLGIGAVVPDTRGGCEPSDADQGDDPDQDKHNRSIHFLHLLRSILERQLYYLGEMVLGT